MFLFKALFWLVTLPIRLVLWVVGLGLWVIFLPLRIVFGVLGMIGFSRLFQLAAVAGIGYFFYRLVNETPVAEAPGIVPPTRTELESVPST